MDYKKCWEELRGYLVCALKGFALKYKMYYEDKVPYYGPQTKQEIKIVGTFIKRMDLMTRLEQDGEEGG